MSETIIYQDEIFTFKFIDIVLDLDCYPEYEYPQTVYKKKQIKYDFVRYIDICDTEQLISRGIVLEQIGDYEYMGDYPLESPSYTICDLKTKKVNIVKITDILAFVPMTIAANKKKVLQQLKELYKCKLNQYIMSKFN